MNILKIKRPEIFNVLFCKRKPDILICLLYKEKSITEISKKLDLNWSDVRIILHKLKEERIVFMEYKGNRQNVSLTKKGKMIAILFKDLYKRLYVPEINKQQE